MSEADWYKDAVIYELRVRSFYDANGDGIGDLRGPIEKLDYLKDLGVSALWLLPLYPSPLRDDGYDIADYMSVHPVVGTLEDFRELLTEAHARGLKVITELVLNHTFRPASWFQRARRAAPALRSVIFTVERRPEQMVGSCIIFQATRPRIGHGIRWPKLLLASLLSHQPDLNFENVQVQVAMLECATSVSRSGSTACGSTRCRICTSAPAPPAKICRRPTPSCGPCAPTSTTNFRDGCCSPRPTNGRKTPPSTSAPATSATCPFTSRSCRGCSWRCAWRTATDQRHSRTDAGHPDVCQWAIFCAP